MATSSIAVKKNMGPAVDQLGNKLMRKEDEGESKREKLNLVCLLKLAGGKRNCQYFDHS